MNILLLAPTYMGLHLPIIQELKRQGHDVVFVEDKMFEFDWKYPYRNFLDRAKRKWDCFIKKRFEEYWYSIFSTRSDLKRHFDELIVINGCSLHPCFLKKIRSLNRNVKAILYLWDNSSFYNYYYYIKEFDKVMTYDINDSKKYGVRLLPFYWENNKNISFFSGGGPKI